METTQFRTKTSIRGYIAEFLGTVFLLLVGVGTVCSSSYALHSQEREDPELDAHILFQPELSMVLTTSLAFGIAFMVLVYGAMHISGGHLNPAVSLSMIIFRQIDPLVGVLYIISQILGATVGVVLVRLMWPRAITAAVGLGANTLTPGLSVAQGFFLEFFGTALLCFTFFNTTVDRQGKEFNSNMAPLVIGFSYFLAHVVLVPLTGCGINPARTFATALISGDWHHHYMYWIAALVGGPFGATLSFIPRKYLLEEEKVEEQTPLLD